MKITFLGTGTSHGVPPIDCMMRGYKDCPKGVCRKAQDDPRYNRTRTSVLFEKDGKTLIADVSADFRQQALRHDIRQIDAVALSHGHIDHFGGLPDIRSYTETAPLHIYASAETLETVQRAFPYMFELRSAYSNMPAQTNPLQTVHGGVPKLIMTELTGTRDIAGFTVTPIPVTHGDLKQCLGLRIDNVGYVPDMKYMPPESEEALKGLDCLILNCLREEREHRTHMLLRESMSIARRLTPKRCYFIHMTHDIDFQTDSGKLDPWMQFSYDGLVINV